MKICCVSPRFIPSMGKRITYISEGLAKNGNKVTVISSNLDHSNRKLASVETIPNLSSIRLWAFKISTKFFMPLLPAKLAMIDTDGFYLEGLGHFSTIVASWFSKIRNKPSILRADWAGGEIISLGIKGIYDKYVKFPTLKNVSCIMVYTEEQKRKISELGIEPEKIFVITNGVDYKRFSTSKKSNYFRKKYNIQNKYKIIVCVVSRMIPFKNLELVINAIFQLKEKHKKVFLIVVGSKTDKEYYKKLVSLIKNLKLENQIFFHSEVDNDKIHNIYKSADIFALPSKPLEGMNLSTLEAMSSGLPIITSHVNVTSDIVKETNSGFVIDDLESFVSSVEKLITTENLRKKLGNNGKKFMKDYSWDKIVLKIENIFQSLVKKTFL